LTAPGSRLDLVDRILSRNLSWVAAADTKIAPVLAIDTAMLGVLAALAPVGFQWTMDSCAGGGGGSGRSPPACELGGASRPRYSRGWMVQRVHESFSAASPSTTVMPMWRVSPAGNPTSS
jgi:hypothetical protein